MDEGYGENVCGIEINAGSLGNLSPTHVSNVVRGCRSGSRPCQAVATKFWGGLKPSTVLDY